LKHNDNRNQEDEIETEEQVELKDIMVMMKNMMRKLDKWDLIETKVKSVEQELRSMKDSIEFAHSEVNDLKSDSEERKKTDELTKQQIEKLEKENEILHKSVIDLKTRSMRDNLVFYNIDENKDEMTLQI
jgi:cell division protein FtsB